jgi:hypothetical protein
METRNVKISLETAQRWYNGTDNELKELAVQTYPEIAKKELPKSWDELKKISGYFISTISELRKNDEVSPLLNEDQNIFATENQAKSSLAMAKLSQLMAVYNDGWVADWSDINQCKFCIVSVSGLIGVDFIHLTKHFLAFKTKELAKEFLASFKEDIETYFNF